MLFTKLIIKIKSSVKLNTTLKVSLLGLLLSLAGISLLSFIDTYRVYGSLLLGAEKDNIYDSIGGINGDGSRVTIYSLNDNQVNNLIYNLTSKDFNSNVKGGDWKKTKWYRYESINEIKESYSFASSLTPIQIKNKMHKIISGKSFYASWDYKKIERENLKYFTDIDLYIFVPFEKKILHLNVNT